MRSFDELRFLLPARSDARRSGRVPMEGSLQCSLGRLLDLSLGGARIKVRRVPRSERVILRLWDEHGGIETEARVAWCKRLGFFRHEIGVRFPPLDDVGRTFLQRMASDHRFRQTINECDPARDAA
jgi:hypothetical protein